VRIVGNWRRIMVLGLGLAAAPLIPASAQTVVGGDWRPQVVVDPGVLDRLGPQPTLPDLLLGRHPMSPPGAPVKLHRPRAQTAAALKPPRLAVSGGELKSTTPKKSAKPVKMAKASAPIEEAPPKAPKAAKPAKTLMSSLEPPPPPKSLKASVPSNADMPASAAPADKAAAPATETKPAPAEQKAVAPPPPAPVPVTKAEEPKPAPKPVAAPPKALTDATAAPAPIAPPAPPAPAKQANQADSPAEAPAAPTKQAMLTPPPQPANADNGASVTIAFAKDGAALADDGKSALVGVAKRASADQSIQVQVLAYASGDEDNASKARRLSLSRALAVRSFLIDQGVHSSRIEVRALGNKVPDGSPDRVDLVEQKH